MLWTAQTNTSQLVKYSSLVSGLMIYNMMLYLSLYSHYFRFRALQSSLKYLFGHHSQSWMEMVQLPMKNSRFCSAQKKHRNVHRSLKNAISRHRSCLNCPLVS